jgi:hypothetical protein
MNFPEIALHVPEILLPNPAIDLNKWSVIACDQYTSQPEYWEKVAAQVDDAPSTLNMILPEVYLESCNEKERVESINRAMREYTENGILVPRKRGFVLVDRKISHGRSRKGLIVALDLERYDYAKGAKTLIRATEDTIVNRLHPRIRIRKNASLELPHIMVLIDDPEMTVIEPLFDRTREKLYDFDLMMLGGHITGWAIDDEQSISGVARNLTRLGDPEFFNTRYGVSGEEALLYAMGDGNHSFATAKALWEMVKVNAADKSAVMNHPARHALVELVNLHDPGLQFEPIHRVLYNVKPDDVVYAMKFFYDNTGSPLTCSEPRPVTEKIPVLRNTPHPGAGSHCIPFITGAGYGTVTIDKPRHSLTVENLQIFLDEYLARNNKADIDYIHGNDVLTALGSKPGAIGFFLPPIAKEDIFKTVITAGNLPRKAFSMGEAEEKRYYLESRRIV